MNTQEVPEWAKEAVADGWTYDKELLGVIRFLNNGARAQLFSDGTGSIRVESGRVLDTTSYVRERTVPEGLVAVNVLAAGKGGWA